MQLFSRLHPRLHHRQSTSSTEIVDVGALTSRTDVPIAIVPSRSRGRRRRRGDYPVRRDRRAVPRDEDVPLACYAPDVRNHVLDTFGKREEEGRIVVRRVKRKISHRGSLERPRSIVTFATSCTRIPPPPLPTPSHTPLPSPPARVGFSEKRKKDIGSTYKIPHGSRNGARTRLFKYQIRPFSLRRRIARSVIFVPLRYDDALVEGRGVRRLLVLVAVVVEGVFGEGLLGRALKRGIKSEMSLSSRGGEGSRNCFELRGAH